MTHLGIPVLRCSTYFLAALLAGIAQAQDDFQPRELAVLAPPEIEGTYSAGSTDFGRQLPPEGVTGQLVHVEDAGTESGEACGPITNAEALAGNVALVRRGECSFCLKADIVSGSTDAIAAVVYNDERVPDDDTTVIDMLNEFCETVDIPLVFVSRATGLLLLDALATSEVTVRLQPLNATDAEDRPEAAALALVAYPNPARGTTYLTLTLPESAEVRVEVFDVLGRRVGLVHSGPLGAGGHALSLDTAGFASGVYVVRATAGGSAGTQRLVV